MCEMCAKCAIDNVTRTSRAQQNTNYKLCEQMKTLSFINNWRIVNERLVNVLI